ncbi:MAG TPA: hypothetical protein VI670_12685 [Thermoanaerobaculia bacterium]|jgi:putative Ca2+/H+ antiporter (TMEM165/GDT1 family)
MWKTFSAVFVTVFLAEIGDTAIFRASVTAARSSLTPRATEAS